MSVRLAILLIVGLPVTAVVVLIGTVYYLAYKAKNGPKAAIPPVAYIRALVSSRTLDRDLAKLTHPANRPKKEE